MGRIGRMGVGGGGAAFAITAIPKKTQGKTNLWILFTETSVLSIREQAFRISIWLRLSGNQGGK
jgi:hypothetical protein